MGSIFEETDSQNAIANANAKPQTNAFLLQPLTLRASFTTYKSSANSEYPLFDLGIGRAGTAPSGSHQQCVWHAKMQLYKMCIFASARPSSLAHTNSLHFLYESLVLLFELGFFMTWW